LSEVLALFLTFLVIFNPPGALLTWRSLAEPLPGSERWPALGGAFALAATLLVVAGFLGEAVIEALDVSLASFQVGAGLLLILNVLRVFVTKNPWVAPRYEGNYESAVAGLRMAFWLANPASLVAVAFYAADRGEADTLVPLALAFAVTGAAIVGGLRLTSATHLLVLREVGRGLAVIVIILAIDLIFDGITRV
jgi:small neutral amino acid transporter SnatA (MarC family)